MAPLGLELWPVDLCLIGAVCNICEGECGLFRGAHPCVTAYVHLLGCLPAYVPLCVCTPGLGLLLGGHVYPSLPCVSGGVLSCVELHVL
jgi:hypothetical protein